MPAYNWDLDINVPVNTHKCQQQHSVPGQGSKPDRYSSGVERTNHEATPPPIFDIYS